jgi:hypothetical protein
MIVRDAMMRVGQQSEIIKLAQKQLSSYTYIFPTVSSVSTNFLMKPSLNFVRTINLLHSHGARVHIGAHGSSGQSNFCTLVVGRTPSFVVRKGMFL